MSLLSRDRPKIVDMKGSPTASSDRQAPNMDQAPPLKHTLRQCGSSVLSIVTDDRHIYSGSQTSDISVWDRNLFVLKTSLRGHTGAILALEQATEKKWLFSSSGDSSVRVWSTISLVCLYVVNPWMETEAGDIFSLAWCPLSETIYLGCQNTSIQFLQCSQLHSGDPDVPAWDSGRSDGSTPSTPSLGSVPRKSKVHKFFNSYPQYERRPADVFAVNGLRTQRDGESSDCVDGVPVHAPLAVLDIPVENVVDSAHYGYVYCMAPIPSIRDGSDDAGSNRFSQHLVTGSGDETLKLWKRDASLTLIHTFEVGRGAVLSVATRGETVFAGCQDGYVTVWDLDTRTLVRAIIVQEDVAILSLSLVQSDLYTGSEDGRVQRHSSTFECTASWLAHEGIILSSIVARLDGRSFDLVTGGSDDQIKVWEVDAPALSRAASQAGWDSKPISRTMDDALVNSLSTFVSFSSISGKLAEKESCRQAAIWLRTFLTQLGADANLLPTGEQTNPLVLATFKGAETDHVKPRVLFYGHYDVISAPADGWDSDPFTLAGRNGYLYGRGVTDNKGPILAVACAAAELLNRRALALDLVFLIEGEEERGSGGFAETVRRHRDTIGRVDAILVSNSTWIAEYPPCITYGLRGVVHCGLEITSGFPDLHSGVEGGAVMEPMFDMVKLLSSLTGSDRRVLLPGFYNRVRPVTEEERLLYQVLSGITQRPASLLSARWSEPCLTVHKIEVSGPNNSTVIPGSVRARVSIRIVPDQDLDAVAASLVSHLETTFAEMKSPNCLSVNVDHKADWWLGSLDDPWFKALEGAVRDEWGVDPLRIREGGSIPSIPFLEKQFGCHALHLPLGQSTDQAHLPNERIALANLRRGKSVIERFLGEAAAIPVTP